MEKEKEKKKFRSILKKYINEELYMKLMKLTMIYELSNNEKGFELKKLLHDYNVPFTSLGSGTNRFGILIDGYAVKFALDPDGMIDNRREFKYSERFYPYVVKVYEAFPNGLAAVTEYVEIFSMSDFYHYQGEMRKILKEISKNFLIGDVGLTSKNYINWGIRTGSDEICILDFAYIYDVKYGVFTCSCDNQTFLKFDSDYVFFVCPRCGRKYTFRDLRKKITRKSQEEEIGDIRTLGYNLHDEEEVLPIDPRFTKDRTKKEKKKKHKKINPAIKAKKDYQQAIKDQELEWAYGDREIHFPDQR